MTDGEFDDAPMAEPGNLLGLFIIAALVLPQLALLGRFVAPHSREENFFVGAYILFVGFLFLAS